MINESNYEAQSEFKRKDISENGFLPRSIIKRKTFNKRNSNISDIPVMVNKIIHDTALENKEMSEKLQDQLKKYFVLILFDNLEFE